MVRSSEVTACKNSAHAQPCSGAFMLCLSPNPQSWLGFATVRNWVLLGLSWGVGSWFSADCPAFAGCTGLGDPGLMQCPASSFPGPSRWCGAGSDCRASPAGLTGSLCSKLWPHPCHWCQCQGLTPDGLCRWGWARPAGPAFQDPLKASTFVDVAARPILLFQPLLPLPSASCGASSGRASPWLRGVRKWPSLCHPRYQPLATCLRSSLHLLVWSSVADGGRSGAPQRVMVWVLPACSPARPPGCTICELPPELDHPPPRLELAEVPDPLGLARSEPFSTSKFVFHTGSSPYRAACSPRGHLCRLCLALFT